MSHFPGTNCRSAARMPLSSDLAPLSNRGEFPGVAVMACDDEIIPSQERIENVADDADLEAVYETERHLLYLACTRARDHLLVTGVNPASEFLDDLVGQTAWVWRGVNGQKRYPVCEPYRTAVLRGSRPSRQCEDPIAP